MAALAFFTETSISAQAANQAYGVESADKFRVSSMFTISTATKAYAMMKGTILLQQQTSDADKVNLILRPHDQKDFKLPVKYIIYRGLQINDFITNNDLSDPANKVKTSGSELLDAIKIIQQNRAPNDDIPLEALFGNELMPSHDKNIDDFFFKNLAPSSQLFMIDCGIELGNFYVNENDDPEEIGIEIILENPEFFVDVELAKEKKIEIKIGSSMSSVEKKWQKDLVRHFADPAAFYGLHFNIKGGIEYRQGANKPTAGTTTEVYQNIIAKFQTKNKVYLDIRNENGYSYNYYGNYLGTGSDANKNIRIGQTATTLVPKEYYNANGWSLHIVSVTPGNGAFNEIFIELRLNDNTKPLLVAWNYKMEKHSSSGKIISDQNVYYADETVLLPDAATEFTNKVSFNVPNVVGGSPAQLATIVRLDYVRQPDSATPAVKFPRRKFTDFLFGSTNLEIPWDTDDKIAWYTANYRTYINAIDDLGFGGIIEAGHIIDIDQSTSDNDRIILYAAPLNFFSYKGIEKAIPFSAKGGVLNFDSILNMIPGTTINRTNLILSPTESILTMSYQFDTKLKKALFMLGVTKAEWQAMITTTASSLSNIHLKLFKLYPSITGAKTDMVGTTYYDYEIIVSGLNSTGVYQEINTGIMVYTIDHLIFSSKLFGEKYQIDYTEAENNLNDFIDNWKFEKLYNYTFEEKNMLEISSSTSNGAKNKILLEKDSSFLTKIAEFKTTLDGVSNYDNLKNLLKEKGADLFLHAKTSIKIETGDSYNKDAFLYLSRLRMQVILKNHPYVLINFNQKIRELYNIFELNSRGLSGTQKPDFSTTSAGVKKILISGFDPFDIGDGSIGKDWGGDISNPSGNIALSMGDVELKVGSVTKAIVKSVIFPVRWEDFDNGLPIDGGISKGIAEDFFEPYFSGPNKPDMIITFSYGVHYDKTIDHDFHLERFAANWQSYHNDNNGVENFNRTKRANYKKANYIKILSLANKNWTFIESTLPFHKLENPVGSGEIKVGNYHTVVNHGPISSKGLNWEVWGRNINSDVNENISNDVMVPYQPSELFPIPFESIPIIGMGYVDVAYMKDHEDKAYFLGRHLVCDNTIIKYFYPKPTPSAPNQYYIPLPTWEKYQIKSFTTHDNIKIEARNGSGGTYISNLIFYRVAYLRQKYGDTIPMGHIHMGFNKAEDDRFDPHSDEDNLRKKMLDDVKEMLKKFNDI